MYFSVIVTAYNVEAYLRCCVDSILAQTFEDFELILVDDGSPDNCPAICDAYGKRDGRVKVIHQENRGVTAARKAGLKVAAGRYVAFVDGDDRIKPEFLKRGYEKIEETEAEMVTFSCTHEYERGKDTEIVHEPAKEGLYQKREMQETIYPSLLMNEEMRHMLYYISGRFIYRPLAEKHFLSVKEEISLGEDMLGVVPVYLESKKVYLCREPLNIYRIRERSGAHGFRTESCGQVNMALEELKKLKESAWDLPEDFDMQILRYGAYMCFTLMIHAVNDGQLCRIGEIRQAMKRPLLRECIAKARFKGISLKAEITYFLLKRNLFLVAYLFLLFCKKIKGIWKGRR